MDERKDGEPQAIAAARAGFSESTARRIGKGRVLVSQRPPRQYRTRADPFQGMAGAAADGPDRIEKQLLAARRTLRHRAGVRGACAEPGL